MPMDLTTGTIILFTGQILFTGVVVAFINWQMASRAERRKGEIDFLNNQLQHLYGPLHFFTCQNSQLLAHIGKLIQAYDSEYVNKKWSASQETQRRVNEDADKVLDLENEYASQILANNSKIGRILEEHWALGDPDDVGVFSQFQIDQNRLATEIRREPSRKIPLPIYCKVGDVFYVRPEFTDLVNRKFRDKQERLKHLLKVRSAPR